MSETLSSIMEQGKLTDWDNEPKLVDLKGDLESAKTNHDAQMLKIDHWEDLRLVRGKARPPKIKGRSSVQPKLIRRQTEWRYSALTEPFLGSNKLFKVSPVTFEDEAASKQNELLLNWQFRTKIDMVKFIDDYVRSCVDEGTAVVRLGWDRVTEPVVETVPVFQFYPAQMEEELAQLQQALELKQANPRGYEEEVPDELKAAVDFYEESGQPTVAVITGYEEVETEKVVVNKPIAEVLNPRNVVVDPSCKGDLDKAMFVVVSFETNKAELEKNPERYKNLDLIDWEGASHVTEPDHITSTPTDFRISDTARKSVVAYEYWGFYDIHNDGKLVPIVATWINNVLIRMEENPFPDKKLPFVLVPYSPVKREIYGEPDAELLEDNQKILGAVTRGMIDLMGRSANAQQGFAKGMLDAVNRRRFEDGKDYEYNPTMHPTNSLIEHKYPEIPNSAMLMINLQNQDAEALSGVKGFSGGLSGEAYGDVAAGIRGMLDAASKREMAILRRLAKGVTKIGEKIIAMNAVFLSEEEVIRVTNRQYITIRREDLQGNFDLEVDISTAEVDDAKSQDLAFMLQTVGPNADPQVTMLILSEIAELKRMPSLAETLRTWRPEPTPEEQEIARLNIEKLRKEVEKLDSEIALNNAKAQKELAEKDLKDLDYVEQESGTKHARDMEKQKGQAQGNQDLQVTKALTSPRKEGESAPNIDAAIGFNALSANMQPGSVPNTLQQRDTLSEVDPRLNLRSSYYDPTMDPALNPNINI